jgi:hypothetical protein
MTKIGGGGLGTTLILALLLVIVSVAAGAGLVYLISTPAATNHASQSSAISRLPTSWWPPFARSIGSRSTLTLQPSLGGNRYSIRCRLTSIWYMFSLSASPSTRLRIC